MDMLRFREFTVGNGWEADYGSIDNENEFVFVEEWESDAALQQHFASSHIAEFLQAIRATIVAPPDVKFHSIASSRDLADVTSG